LTQIMNSIWWLVFFYRAACHKATPNIGPHEYWPHILQTQNFPGTICVGAEWPLWPSPCIAALPLWSYFVAILRIQISWPIFARANIRRGLVTRSPNKFIHLPINCRCHEDQVRAKQTLDQWQWNGGSLVNYNQLRLSQFLCIRRLDELDRLPVVVVERNRFRQKTFVFFFIYSSVAFYDTDMNEQGKTHGVPITFKYTLKQGCKKAPCSR